MTNGDKVLLPPNHPLIASVLASLHANGQTADVVDILIGDTTVTQITVVGKRQGEGQIAADMKRRAK